MTELFARETIDIDATPARLWRVLTAPELTREYMFGCEAVTDWKPGSQLLWRGVHEGREVVFVQGHVLEIEPERRLRYTTFGPNTGLEDVPANYLTVTYELTPHAGGVRLDVSQGDFGAVQDGKKRYDESAGGWRSVVSAIKALAERVTTSTA